MRFALSLAALAALACNTSDPELAIGDQMPVAPGTPDFVVSQLLGGSTGRITWADLTPGDEVTFLLSETGTGSGPCPPQLGGTCLDILSPVVRIGTATVTPEGYATLEVSPPGTVPFGVDVAFQAVIRDFTGPAEKSRAVIKTTGFGICPLIWAPVCGVNAFTFGNDCEAYAQGWPIDYTGPC